MNLENNNIDNKRIPDDELDQVSGGTDPVIDEIEPLDPGAGLPDMTNIFDNLRPKTENPHHTIKGEHGPRR